jgi:hypothetical protein
VTRRSDHLDAESSEVVDQGPKHVDVCFARVTPACTHLAQFQRATEYSSRPFVQSFAARFKLSSNHEIFTPPCRQSVLVCQRDCTRRAGQRAFRAKKAAAHVEGHSSRFEQKRISGADVGTLMATLGAKVAVEPWSTPKSIG